MATLVNNIQVLAKVAIALLGHFLFADLKNRISPLCQWFKMLHFL